MIKIATVADIPRLERIYSYYVKYLQLTRETIVTFDLELDTAFFKSRLEFPIYVLITDKIVGYAYVSAFRSKQAYNRTAETTIYIDPDCRGL